MLTRQMKGTIPSTLTVEGHGEKITFKVTYHNRPQREVLKMLEEAGDDVREVILFMVESWDAEYELSLAGLSELEDDRPGMYLALIAGFHEARKVEKVKN